MQLFSADKKIIGPLVCDYNEAKFCWVSLL